VNAKKIHAKQGAPEQHPTDVLYTQLWFHGLKARSGLESTQALELVIEPPLGEPADCIDRCSKYRSYEAGLRVPTRIRGKVYAPDLAEARFPGTAAVLDSPLKTLLKREPCSLGWIDEQLRAASTEVRALLFTEAPSNIGRSPGLQFFDEQRSQALGSLGTFGALTAAVLLMKRAELIASPELRENAWRAYVRAVPKVSALPMVVPVAEDFFNAIDKVFKHWVYTRPDDRMDFQVLVYATRKDFKGSDEEYIEAVAGNVRGMLVLRSMTRSLRMTGLNGESMLGVDFG